MVTLVVHCQRFSLHARPTKRHRHSTRVETTTYFKSTLKDGLGDLIDSRNALRALCIHVHIIFIYRTHCSTKWLQRAPDPPKTRGRPPRKVRNWLYIRTCTRHVRTWCTSCIRHWKSELSPVINSTYIVNIPRRQSYLICCHG